MGLFAFGEISLVRRTRRGGVLEILLAAPARRRQHRVEGRQIGIGVV